MRFNPFNAAALATLLYLIFWHSFGDGLVAPNLVKSGYFLGILIFPIAVAIVAVFNELCLGPLDPEEVLRLKKIEEARKIEKQKKKEKRSNLFDMNSFLLYVPSRPAPTKGLNGAENSSMPKSAHFRRVGTGFTAGAMASFLWDDDDEILNKPLQDYLQDLTESSIDHGPALGTLENPLFPITADDPFGMTGASNDFLSSSNDWSCSSSIGDD